MTLSLEQQEIQLIEQAFNVEMYEQKHIIASLLSKYSVFDPDDYEEIHGYEQNVFAITSTELIFCEQYTQQPNLLFDTMHGLALDQHCHCCSNYDIESSKRKLRPKSSGVFYILGEEVSPEKNSYLFTKLSESLQSVGQQRKLFKLQGYIKNSFVSFDDFLKRLKTVNLYVTQQDTGWYSKFSVFHKETEFAYKMYSEADDIEAEADVVSSKKDDWKSPVELFESILDLEK
jgi:hypothetical protein